MPKIKSKKSIKDRFKVTGSGKLKRTRPGRRHLLSKKTSKRKRKLRQKAMLSKCQEKTYLTLIGHI